MKLSRWLSLNLLQAILAALLNASALDQRHDHRVLPDVQIFRAGLLFKQTYYKVQLVGETLVLQLPFSLDPVRRSVRLTDQFSAETKDRMEEMVRKFGDMQRGTKVLKGKWEVRKRHNQVVKRAVSNVHDSLRNNYKRYKGKTQRALAMTLGVKEPPKAWYKQKGARVRNASPGSLFSSRSTRAANKTMSTASRTAGSANKTVSAHPVSGARDKRGAVAVAGTVASLIPYDKIWPLISDQPVLPTLHSWLQSISGWFTRGPAQGAKEKAIEKEVHHIFQSQKAPKWSESPGLSDPTLWDLWESISSPEGEVKLLKGVSQISNVSSFPVAPYSKTPQADNRDSISSDVFEHARSFSKDYNYRYSYNPALGDMVVDYTGLIDGVHAVDICLMTVLMECQESLLLIDSFFAEQDQVVSAFIELLEDLARGSSIQQSRPMLRAWKEIVSDVQDDTILASASKQLKRVVPRMYLGSGRPEFEIHVVIEHWDEDDSFDLYRSQVVPFKTNLGHLQVVIPETAQIVNQALGAIYRFDWTRLTECGVYEGYYLCHPSVIESDSRGNCIQAITDTHMRDATILEKCTVASADSAMRLVRLGDDAIYFDVEKVTASLRCEAMRSLELTGKGIIHLNPGCTVTIGIYTFSNERGLTFSNTGLVVSVQREMTFPEMSLKEGNRTVQRFEPTPDGWTVAEIAQYLWAVVLVSMVALFLGMVSAWVVFTGKHKKPPPVRSDPEVHNAALVVQTPTRPVIETRLPRPAVALPEGKSSASGRGMKVEMGASFSAGLSGSKEKQVEPKVSLRGLGTPQGSQGRPAPRKRSGDREKNLRIRSETYEDVAF